MIVGEEKYFIKSGNRVRLVERLAPGLWSVERVDGKSQGKRMLCHEKSLVESMEIAS